MTKAVRPKLCALVSLYKNGLRLAPYANETTASTALKKANKILNEANSPQDLATASYRQGLALYSLSNTNEALKAFQKAVIHDHTFAKAHLWYGISLYESDKITEALDQLRLACGFDEGLILPIRDINIYAACISKMEGLSKQQRDNSLEDFKLWVSQISKGELPDCSLWGSAILYDIDG